MKTKFANDAARFFAGCIACGVLLLSSMHAHAASAVPTGSDLLFACRESIKSGFEGVRGQMCTWYATPCDCSIEEGLPRVCLPEELALADAARIIVQGLTNDTALQMRSATEAATVILARNYPCQAVE